MEKLNLSYKKDTAAMLLGIKENQPETKFILSLSMGKDSMALAIIIKLLGLPLDEIIFCDIRFNNFISGEMPQMAAWIPTAEKQLFDLFGIQVKHITAKVTFCEQFYTVKQKGKHIGDNYGFPYVIDAWCNDRLKMRPIRDYLKQYKCPIVEYVGIAKDEPTRLAKFKKKETKNHKYITLGDLGITEYQAMEVCDFFDLLSPIYKTSFRAGCWFCPKQNLTQLKYLFEHHPEYWNILKQMEKDSHNTFKPGKTLNDLERKFKKSESV